jgi:hypothetical protein
MVVSRELFMKALNVSLSILKRRARDREKRRAQSVQATRFFIIIEGQGRRRAMCRR